jgi:hypothetical protein
MGEWWLVISGGWCKGWRKLSKTSIAIGVEQLAVTEAFLGSCCTLFLGDGPECFPLPLLLALVLCSWSFPLHGPIDY